MSAVIPGAPHYDYTPNGSTGRDGIRRYKTRCKILIDSHNSQYTSQTIELFEDIVSVSLDKTLKGAGQATVALIPSKNYLNIIFPNDYINIYFDIGDGTGWTRTFFGFVDRIEEAYKVGDDGTPNTLYSLMCTDFYKALEKTQIYFNPQLSGRKDFIDFEFAKLNIGGLALMSKGVVAGGSPPDVIANVLLLLIGFGTQFRLPSSYLPGSTQDRLRKARADLVYGRLNEEALIALSGQAGGYEQIRADANADAAGTVSTYDGGRSHLSEEDRIKAMAEEFGVPIDPNGTLEENTTDIIKVLAEKKIRETINLSSKRNERGAVGTSDADRNANYSILESTFSENSSLIDVLDIFTFVERRAIDGYMFGQPVWQKQGSLASILTSFSNEAMNELFYDLRPLSSDSSASGISAKPVEGSYARATDDKQGNVARPNDPAPAGITYIPAVIMREYPFSTIDGLDLQGVNLQLEDAQGKPESIGLLYFGAIFSDKENQPGRHVLSVDNLNIADKAEGESFERGTKHLDVAVISEEEIMETSLGRSDTDHFNLFEFYSDNLLGTDQRFYMRDMLPVITPIHILRNGIRVRSVTTRAARFSIEAVRNYSSAGFKDQEAAEVTEEEPTTLPVVARKDIVAPVYQDPGLVRYNGGDQANWGYRPKTLPKSTTDPKEKAYIFHQGIDISKRPLKLIRESSSASRINESIPIRAIADGWIVVSCPQGGFDGYGNVVVIKHKFAEIGGFRYSVYGHLKSIKEGWGAGNGTKTTTRNARGRFCSKDHAPGVGNGTKTTIWEIKKDTVIGYMGSTGFTDPMQKKNHLHFEIDRHFPPRKDSVTAREPIPGPVAQIPADFDHSGTEQEIMINEDQRSADPEEFYLWHGINLKAFINGSASYEEQTSNGSDTDSDMGDDSEEEREQRPKDDVGDEKGKDLSDPSTYTAATRELVDTSASRSQIIRWALLQDHWYQHNLEYLSGAVVMRGAPEIRVGYRLDVAERNMSYYVEGVKHAWQFPDNMVTTLSVSRGQPNNPYPLYVYPSYDQMGAPKEQRRTSKSRLATYFVSPDPIAIRRSLFIKNGGATRGGGGTEFAAAGSYLSPINKTDDLGNIEFEEDTGIATLYNELVLPAGSSEYAKGMDSLETPEEDAAFDELIGDDRPKLDPLTGTKSADGVSKTDPTESK